MNGLTAREGENRKAFRLDAGVKGIHSLKLIAIFLSMLLLLVQAPLISSQECWESGALYDGYPLYRRSIGEDDDVNDDGLEGGTGILPDEDSVRDRYWEITPVNPQNPPWNANWMDYADGTRPGYGMILGNRDDESHSMGFDYGSSYYGLGGVLNCEGRYIPGCEAARDHYCRPVSAVHQPCDPCRGHYNCPELCFNYDLRYYRMFNINTVWANIFKITPEVNMPIKGPHYPKPDEDWRIPDVEPSCEPKTPSIIDELTGEIKMGDGEGPCYSSDDCASGYCSIDPNGEHFGHCCPTADSSPWGIDCPVTDYDLTHECCMCGGINNAYRGDADYCQKKRARGMRCLYEEGHCRDDSDCAGNLICLDNPYTDFPDSACCIDFGNQRAIGAECDQNLLGQIWDGKNCITVLDTTYKYPWLKSWTRTGELTPGVVDGGGPIMVHMAGGGMIPNYTEAACPTNGDVGRGKYPHCEKQTDCYYAWPFNENPSPIWAETRNIGNLYVQDVTTYSDDSAHYTCPASDICQAGEEVTCYVKGWSDPRYWTKSGRKCGCRFGRGGSCRVACGQYDCNCGRDLDQPGGGGPVDPEISGYETACVKGPALPEYGCCGAWDFWPGNRQSNCWIHRRQRCRRGRVPDNWDAGFRNHDLYISTGVGGDTGIVPVETGDENALVPASCGALKMKEVDAYPYAKEGRVKSGNAPYSWFEYGITAAGDGSMSGSTGPGRSPENELPQPTDPWTVLNYETIPFTIGPRGYGITASTSFTIRNYMNRRPYVEQCMWHGCSRLEVDIHFYRHGYKVCINADTGMQYTVSLERHFNNPERDHCTTPCCCWRDNNMCNARNGHCVCGGDYCGDDVEVWCEMWDECYCHEHCWGCWHHRGTRFEDYYPVTEPNAAPEKGLDPNSPEQPVCESGECIKFEEFEDISTVTAEPYGSHLTVAQPLPVSDHVRVSVTGEIKYKIPATAAADDFEVNYTRVRAYLTIQAIDNDPLDGIDIDLFNGFELEVPHRVTLVYTAPFIPVTHELTSLESAFGWDYNVVPRGEHKVAEFLGFVRGGSYNIRPCTTNTHVPPFSNAADPLYYVGNYNPLREYLNFIDIYSGLRTIYNGDRGVLAVDRGNPRCINWFMDPWYNKRLYHNWQQDGWRAWDFEALSIIPKYSEQLGRQYINQPFSIRNVFQKPHVLGGELPLAYVMYAPYCNNPAIATYLPELQDRCYNLTSMAFGGDCQWRPGWPIPEDECRNVEEQTKSKWFYCDKAPSKYKDYCGVDGNYYSFKNSRFRVSYYWNDLANRCEVVDEEPCQVKSFLPQSYTLIFESTDIDPKDWDDATLTVHTMLRSVKLKPFRSDPQADECETEVVCSVGNVYCRVRKPHELKPFIEKTEDASNIYLTIRALDLCTGAIIG